MIGNWKMCICTDSMVLYKNEKTRDLLSVKRHYYYYSVRTRGIELLRDQSKQRAIKKAERWMKKHG